MWNKRQKEIAEQLAVIIKLATSGKKDAATTRAIIYIFNCSVHEHSFSSLCKLIKVDYEKVRTRVARMINNTEDIPKCLQKFLAEMLEQ